MSETKETKEERAPENEEAKKETEEIPQEEASGSKEDRKAKKEEKNPKKELQRLQKECEEQRRELSKLQKEREKFIENEKAQNERFLRLAAEYDNFRRRSAAEKDAIYGDATTDVLKEILPVIDALELAVKYGGDGEKVLKGVEMTLAKFSEALGKLGVEPVKTEIFDPNYHNAVMHIEDESKGEGEIVEVFQKGYKKGDKIIRYAMVKVAN